ncbi:septum formation protein Maf [bacterium]|nr:septum formation protein Maf [bacterium]
MRKIILASSSPRRKEIFKALNIDFEIIPSSYKEVMENDFFSYEKIENLAYNKALVVAKSIKESALIVGADTVVVLGNKIMGKPRDREDAYNMLRSLSDREHSVVTAICVIETPDMHKQVCSTTSYVEFENLTDEMINKYIDEFKPFDKAGSYGIQELPKGFVKQIKGSYENIVGLCPKALEQTLNTFKH